MGNKSNPNVIKRLGGREGKKRLIEAIQNHELVSGDILIAKELAKYATVHTFKPEDAFIKQGEDGTDIYFILGGKVGVEVNGREVAQRKAGEYVGEMALLDITAVRSATVRVIEKTVVAKIPENVFSRIANKYPILWRKIAGVLSKRLTERNKFHNTPRSQPVIFIGSSSESLELAKVIQKKLLSQKYNFAPRLWTDNIFKLSKTTIEDLMRIAKEIDFAVMVLSPDDITISRKQENNSPRDNVIFELGLFMGALSRERAFIVIQESKNVKMPTDLLGVNCLYFKRQKGGSLSRSLNPPLKKLIKNIQDAGSI